MVINFIIILSFLVLFGGILYMLLHKLLKVWKDEKIKPRTRALWMWRVMLVTVLLFLIFIILLNQNIFFLILSANTSMGNALAIFVFVFFISLLEITIIDLILPDVVSVWKRMLVETLSLIVLVFTTTVIFLLFVVG